MVQNFEQIVANAWLVVVHIAGRVNRYLARCFSAIGHLCGLGLGGGRAEFAGGQRGQPCVFVDAQHAFHGGAGRLGVVHRIGNLHHHGNASELAMHIGAGQKLFAHADFTFFKLDGLGAQHGVRKIQVPFVGRHIGAFGQVAQVAQIALVHHRPVVFFVNAVHFHGLAVVHQIKQRRKRAAQAHTAAAAMANIKNALHLLEGRLFVVIIWALPVNRMPSGSLQVAFGCHVVSLPNGRVIYRNYGGGHPAAKGAKGTRKALKEYQSK